jgi:hypothetical protein
LHGGRCRDRDGVQNNQASGKRRDAAIYVLKFVAKVFFLGVLSELFACTVVLVYEPGNSADIPRVDKLDLQSSAGKKKLKHLM